MKKIGIIGHIGANISINGVARSLTEIIDESKATPYHALPEIEMPTIFEPPINRRERRAMERRLKKR